MFSPAHRDLVIPGRDRRALRRPDLRTLHTPRPSGMPMGGETDHDDLIIHRAYRVYDEDTSADGAQVKYFVFEFSQRNPGDTEWFSGFKVVRMLRLTRVPRYLRGGSGGGGLNLVFQQQRDVLAALREQQVLFLNLVASAPDMPLAFCYGTQAVGSTFAEAAAQADESFEVLRFQLMGTYQQLKVAPLTVDEGERIAQYQAEWRNVAMARGRPLPNGGAVPTMGDLDGNRTEAANNQMEAFIRGMSGSSFMMTLVTVPLSPAEMTMAWRNLSTRLSEVRSDQQGARAVTAGVALPLAMGTTFGESHGDTHATGASEAVGDSYGVSQSVSDSHAVSEAATASASVTDGASRSVSVGESLSATQGVSASEAVVSGESVTVGQSLTESLASGETVGRSASVSDSASQSVATAESVTQGQSVTESASASQSVTQSQAVTEGLSESVSVGESASVGQSTSMTQGSSVSEGASLGASVSEGQSASSTLSESFNATRTQMEGWSESLSESLQQSFSVGATSGDSISGSEGVSNNAGFTGGLLGFSGSNGVTLSDSFGSSVNSTENVGMGMSGGNSSSSGVSGSQSSALGQGVSLGETMSQTVTQGQSATNSVSQSDSVSATQGLNESFGRTVSETMAASQSLSQGLTQGQSVGQGLSVGQTLSRGATLSEGMSVGQSATQGVTSSQSSSQGVAQGQAVSQGQSLAQSVGSSRSASATQGVTSAESAGVSQSSTQGASRSSGESLGRSVTAGESAGVASNRSLSDAYMVAMSNTASNTGSLGAVPSVGVSVSRQTFDESKRLLGDVLESQVKRFVEGMESGAFLYQCFVTAPDASTLKGAAALMKSAFWGAGADSRVAQPFHVITDIDDAAERGRLLDHARCFTSYRRREPVTEEISPFLYSSYITPTELSALTHPPTANALGLETQFDSLPVLAMPSDRASKELYLGQVVNGERGEISDARYGLDVAEMTHALITGVTGSGKALALDTPIATPDGWTTMERLRVGDRVFGADGRPTEVTFATDAMQDHTCYRVTFSDGTSIVADAGHLWDVSTYHSRFNDRRATARQSNLAERLSAQARRARLVSHAHAGDLATVRTIIRTLKVPQGVVYQAVASCTPVGTSTVTFEQAYDGQTVTKTRPVDTYDLAQVAGLVAAELEERAAKHARMPLTSLLTTAQMAGQVERGDGGRNLAIKLAGPLQAPDADLPVDPYLLGLWLGDGTTGAAELTLGEQDAAEITRLVGARGYKLERSRGLRYRVVAEAWEQALESGLELVGDGWTISSAARQAGCSTSTLGARARDAGLRPGTRRLRRGTPAAPKALGARAQLTAAGVRDSKRIPVDFLRAGTQQRLELLRGLVDSDGHVSVTGNVVIEMTNRDLMRDVLELVRSLGIDPSWREGRAQLDGRDCGPTWAVSFTTSQPVALLTRKAERLAETTRSTSDWRYVTSVEHVESVPVRCIEVAASDHLFLAGESMVPTHNTTTLMRYLTELTQVTREVTVTDTATGQVQTKQTRASVLGLDWMRNMRNLGSILDDDRFHFYSVSKPEMGAFRWNLLAIPAAGMSAAEWLNQQADNMVASWNLGEFGRSLIAEFLGDLYAANRLEPYVLLEAQTDEDGHILREGIVLDPVDRDQLPEGAIKVGADGREYANVYTCPELSRLVSIEHLAILVMARVEQMRDPDAARLYGTAMRDRLQSLWRRISYFAPNGVLNELFGCDASLTDRRTLTVSDLVDPDEGRIVIIETDGLDYANRRLILGSVLLAVYRFGLEHGEGVFDHGGQGPGLHVILEEAHELFGEGGEDADGFSVATRNSLYESLFRRARALGARLVAVAQNPGALPVAVTSNTSTVLVHRCYDTDDRKRVFDLLNWSNQVSQQQREWRFLGEMPVGWCIARLHARDSYLESAPVLVKAELAPVEQLTDAEMVARAARLGRGD